MSSGITTKFAHAGNDNSIRAAVWTTARVRRHGLTVRCTPIAETLECVRHVAARTEEIQHSYSFLADLQLEIGVFIHLLSYNYKI